MTQGNSASSFPSLIVPREKAKEHIKIQIEKGRKLRDTIISSEADFDRAQGEKRKWGKYTTELLARLFDSTVIVRDFTYERSVVIMPRVTARWFTNEFLEVMNDALTDLEAIYERLDLIPEGNLVNNVSRDNTSGGRIFIGHGRSNAWRDLKDFIQDDLHLLWDEFNREPSAGLATKERIEDMLNNAVFALFVLTAEDEHLDGTFHARENVIHEAGLFQGRLGIKKAIILRDEGCAEFSNIHGLTQIPYPKGNVMAKSEEIRRVLKREGISK